MGYLEEHRNEIFKKYTKEELIKDIKSYQNGKGKLQKTLNHFFEELIFEACGKKSNISPMDFLHNDEWINNAFEYIKTKPNFYTGTDVANLKTYLRNAVSWVRKVANFCPKNAREIYQRYYSNQKELNILDTSAGYGSRMSAALLNGHNYFGIDPNKNLFLKLIEYYDFLYENNLLTQNQKFNLFCQGSEIFIPELENKIDVSFTSPPYFNLEKYADDSAASSRNYNNYNKWLEEFVYPTIENTYKYLKIGGYAMVNVKNLTKKIPLYDDFFKAFSSINGFEYIETFEMKLASIKNYGGIPSTEPVLAFKKSK